MRNKKVRSMFPIAMAIALAVAGVVLADVVYIYTGEFHVTTTNPPLTFSPGPNAYPINTTAQPYLSVNTSKPELAKGFNVTFAATNATGAYYYQAVTMTVNTKGYLYVSSISMSGSQILNNMTIYVQDTRGNTVCSFTVISNSVAASPTECFLDTGKYYISILAYFNTPVDNNYKEFVFVKFGYNVVANTTVPIP